MTCEAPLQPNRRFRLTRMREFASLFEAPSPAVLTTYRKDGTAVASPVWFRFRGETFEVVIAEDDVKLRHLAARPECEFLVFEAVPPFRGVRVRSDQPILTRDGAQQARHIARVTSATSSGEGSPPNAPAPASCCAFRRFTRRPGTSRRSFRADNSWLLRLLSRRPTPWRARARRGRTARARPGPSTPAHAACGRPIPCR